MAEHNHLPLLVLLVVIYVQRSIAKHWHLYFDEKGGHETEECFWDNLGLCGVYIGEVV